MSFPTHKKLGKRSYLISFIGMDGAGKTTASTNLLKALEKKGFKAIYLYLGRGRDNILPIQFVGKNVKVTSSVEKDSKTTKKKKSKISLVHTLAAPVFALDLWLRYQFKVKPLRKKYDIVLTDRYTTDILLMNKVPYSLKKFLYFFFKKPEITFYLYNSVDVLYERKGHPRADLKRQENIFKHINKIVKPIKIKTDSQKDTNSKIMKALEKILRK